jgi:hypothetical protein
VPENVWRAVMRAARAALTAALAVLAVLVAVLATAMKCASIIVMTHAIPAALLPAQLLVIMNVPVAATAVVPRLVQMVIATIRLRELGFRFRAARALATNPVMCA